MLIGIGILDLAHGRGSATKATAHVHIAAVGEERDDERGDEGRPAEP